MYSASKRYLAVKYEKPRGDVEEGEPRLKGKTVSSHHNVDITPPAARQPKSDCAFYVNRTGRRTKKEFLVCWDGTPTGFALRPPYILAFTSSCVEVWHIETGTQVQVIPGVNVRLLCEGTRPSNIAGEYTDDATLEEVLMVSGDSVLVLRSVSDNV
ncbi:CNH domain-containing protein [Mycena olivaceomarginata]|nr:CNH domain-containing protein [Mycena olivaceomarginata]